MPDKKLKSTGITLDGTPIALRPLLPEDEPALQDLFAHMSREDVRLRFFTPMRELKHALAARLSHLDYSREMALVAQHDSMTLGVARYSPIQIGGAQSLPLQCVATGMGVALGNCLWLD